MMYDVAGASPTGFFVVATYSPLRQKIFCPYNRVAAIVV
jgi:hypothetical protein